LAKHLSLKTHQTPLASASTEITLFATERAVVDLAVAIVIFAIADLDNCLDACTRSPFSALTSLSAFFAGADILSARSGGSALALAAFVDLAVAIVVFAVADLGLWFGGGAAFPLSSAAGLFAASTSSLTITREIFVDLAIAIVVFVVADLGAWGATGALHVLASTALVFAICLELGGASIAVARTPRTLVIDASAAFLLALGFFFESAARTCAKSARTLVIGAIAPEPSAVFFFFGSTARACTSAPCAFVIDTPTTKLCTIAGLLGCTTVARAKAASTISAHALASEVCAILILGGRADLGGSACPKAGLFVGPIPAKAKVDVIGVWVGTCVSRPRVGAAIRTPDLFVPDHVHDAQTTGHGVFVALGVGGKQPLDQRIRDVLLCKG